MRTVVIVHVMRASFVVRNSTSAIWDSALKSAMRTQSRIYLLKTCSGITLIINERVMLSKMILLRKNYLSKKSLNICHKSLIESYLIIRLVRKKLLSFRIKKTGLIDTNRPSPTLRVIRALKHLGQSL